MTERNEEVPFTVDTDLDLGRAAAPWLRAHGADVKIRYGAVPHKLPEMEAEGPTWQCAGNRVLIALPWGVRFLVEGGESIRYTAPGDFASVDRRLFLLGTAWLALALQRGLLPLYASAVVCNDAVYAFTGPSGIGKSTLTTAISARGYEFFGDDVLLLAPPARFGDDVRCYAYQDLKLWQHGATLAGVRLGSPVREAAGYDKRYVEPPRQSRSPVGRLKSLYVLRRSPPRPEVHAVVESLLGRLSIEILYRSILHKNLAKTVVEPSRFSEWVAASVQSVDIHRFHRPMVDERFDEGLRKIAEALSGREGGT